MPQHQIERRKHVRRTVLLPCRLNDAKTATIQMIELSEGGCFVATRETVVAAGSDVTLHATLADTELAFTGRVIHERQGWGFAVEFADLSKETRQQIELFLSRVPTLT